MSNLVSRKTRQMILMNLEHELRAVDQARFNSDGIYFDSIEGRAWVNRVFEERFGGGYIRHWSSKNGGSD